jgi:hypothetical protein
MAGEQPKHEQPNRNSPDQAIGDTRVPAGVGAQQPQEQHGEAGDAGSGESFVPDAKQGAYVFKAGSALPEDRTGALDASQIFLVRYRDELHAITADDLRAAFPELAAQHASQTGTIDLRKILRVRAASTRSVIPELIGAVGSNNIVYYDGRFYVVPHSVGAINNWGEQDIAGLPGIVAVRTGREAFAVARGKAGAVELQVEAERTNSNAGRRDSASQPRLVKTLDSYNIVEYEGWYYGLPLALGNIQLETVDVIEMPGVIRDVSADVVEREIQELKR